MVKERREIARAVGRSDRAVRVGEVRSDPLIAVLPVPNDE
jgi:hypothetical protein